MCDVGEYPLMKGSVEDADSPRRWRDCVALASWTAKFVAAVSTVSDGWVASVPQADG